MPQMSNAGVYIHVPFCRARCSYCDFATSRYDRAAAKSYVTAVVEEIGAWREVDQPREVDTVYFGGGTPSLLSALQVTRILEAVRDRFSVLDGAEVTIEMNPATVISGPQSSLRLGGEHSPEDTCRRGAEGAGVRQRKLPLAGTHDQAAALSTQKLRDFRGLGINRASFGAQTFDDRELRHLGRRHTSEDIGRTFSQLREAGFENISFDLIGGLPGQKLDAWSRNLDSALALRPEHLSLYLLEVHEATVLGRQIRRGLQPQPDPDLAAEMYRLMVGRVCAAGYEHYEISNFCLPGFASRHNTKYWTGAPYYGFGCSAHSYDGRFRRWANERDTSHYVKLVESGDSPINERIELRDQDCRSESIFLGMRMLQGISLDDFRARFGADLRDDHADEIDRLSEAGLIECKNDWMRLTPAGALLSNEVFAALA